MRGRPWIIAIAALLLIGATDDGAHRAAPALVDAGPPATRFDPATAPPAPDYDGPANWVSLPWIRDDGDTVPKGVDEPPQLRAPVDVFFIHAAVPLRQPLWNADPADVWFNGDVGQTTIRNQASVFNGCCAIYAPRYRQPNRAAIARSGRDGEAAIELAYGDILRAFRAFRARVGDRPFILAGDGGGARLGRMLIERAIDGTPLARRMVVAYLTGDPVPVRQLDRLRDVRQCRGATDTGCIAAWTMTQLRGGRAACINPVTWTADRTESPLAAHLGAWLRGGLEFPEPLRAPDAALVTMRCGRDGRLHVSDVGPPYRGGDAAPIGLDLQLPWMDVRANAIARVAAFRARGG